MEIFLHSSSSPLFKNANAYLFLYLVDGMYGFLDLIFFLVNHFRLLNHAAPSSRKPFSASKPRCSFLTNGLDANESCMQLRSYWKGQKFDTT